ncbi:MAG: DUF3127 domain-containing protein [Flavobacteriia bacterium]|nr:DUF3127 domain-containing protein [Flavobacteriia bacterium]
MFKIQGVLKVANPMVQVSEKFSKREFVLTDNSGMFPQDILFQLSQEKCSLLDSYQLGDVLDVSFNIRGREWTSPQGEVKYFNSLEAWRIESQSKNTQIPAGGPSAMNLNPTSSTSDKPTFSTESEEDDVLPF